MERTKYQILRALQKGPMSFWSLIRCQDSTLSEFTRTITRMLSQKEIMLTAASHTFSLRTASKVLPEENPLCPSCDGKGVVPGGRFEEALKRFLDLTGDRPSPAIAYNQGIIDPRDLALKADTLYRRGDLEGRSILLLGDDDLFSIFLALLGYESTLLVLEIDDRLIQYIRATAQRHRLPITTRCYDVNADLPPDLMTAWDTFVTEPPEGLNAMLLFLRRGIDALRPRGAGYFGLTTLESSLAKWLEIQRFLTKREMVITDLLRNFSLYPEEGDPVRDYERFPIARSLPVASGPPDVDYFRSSLIRVEKTDIMARQDHERFYSDEETWVTVDPGGGQ
jgi:predicted methyltransferase